MSWSEPAAIIRYIHAPGMSLICFSYALYTWVTDLNNHKRSPSTMLDHLRSCNAKHTMYNVSNRHSHTVTSLTYQTNSDKSKCYMRQTVTLLQSPTNQTESHTVTKPGKYGRSLDIWQLASPLLHVHAYREIVCIAC